MEGEVPVNSVVSKDGTRIACDQTGTGPARLIMVYKGP